MGTIGGIVGIISDMFAPRLGLQFSLKRLFFLLSLRFCVRLDELARFLLALPDEDITPPW